jgi:hypothetical protein
VTSSLAWQCHLRDKTWSLYFFEVMTDQQTLGFRPTLYLNVGEVRDLKRRALDCHQSQKPDSIWEVHDKMHRRRGTECGVQYAEAYIQASPLKAGPELPLPFLRPQK